MDLLMVVDLGYLLANLDLLRVSQAEAEDIPVLVVDMDLYLDLDSLLLLLAAS